MVLRGGTRKSYNEMRAMSPHGMGIESDKWGGGKKREREKLRGRKRERERERKREREREQQGKRETERKKERKKTRQKKRKRDVGRGREARGQHKFFMSNLALETCIETP